MAITLHDPIRPRDRSSRRGSPDIGTGSMPSAPPTIAEELLDAFRSGGRRAETSFELGSPGGHARTVTGTVVYLDEEAQTLMVRTLDGRLTRVPLRDVTSAQGDALSVHEELRSRLRAGDPGIGTSTPGAPSTSGTG